MLILLILCLNFVVSWSNAYACGRVWAETKALGGFPRLLVWCGAIQSAIGFSSVIGFFLGWIAYATGELPPHVLKQAGSLWYVVVVFPAIGTGLTITIESWRVAFRDRSLLNMGTAVYNTVVQLHNTYDAYHTLGDAFGDVGDLFGSLGGGDDDEDSEANIALLAIVLVAVSLLMGCILTYALICKYAATDPLPRLSGGRRR